MMLLGSLTVSLALLGSADPARLALADLAEYRAALRPPSSPAAAVDATFRDLWDRPDAYRGRVVRVSGRLARVFRQGAVGDFPDLAEGWITSPAGDPIGLVFPAPRADRLPALGSTVTFVGTSLRTIRYTAGDGDRLAPLVVGPGQPEVGSGGRVGARSWSALDYGLAVLGTGAVGLVLARRFLDRPVVRRPRPVDPPPPFIDQAGVDAP